MSIEYERWAEEVRRLAANRRAVILAHNYQVPWIQDVADFVGDSLQLSRQAADTDAETIVFCGVHFMAETAKILSPHKTVLIPDLDAGCSLASSITAADVRRWKDEHPGALVVAYVNTSAEAKAESDIRCTSSKAVDVVRSVPHHRPLLCPPARLLRSLREGVFEVVVPEDVRVRAARAVQRMVEILPVANHPLPAAVG